MKLKKNFIPRIIYDAKMTFLKNSFTAYNTTKKD